jgi:hypothetical protein
MLHLYNLSLHPCKIKTFAEEHHKLTFIEVLFTTLSKHNNFTIVTPIQFSEIDCCKSLDISVLDPNKLYHPIKNLESQYELRQNITWYNSSIA